MRLDHAVATTCVASVLVLVATLAACSPAATPSTSQRSSALVGDGLITARGARVGGVGTLGMAETDLLRHPPDLSADAGVQYDPQAGFNVHLRFYRFRDIAGAGTTVLANVCSRIPGDTGTNGSVYRLAVAPGPEPNAFHTTDGLTFASTMADVIASRGAPDDRVDNGDGTESLVYRVDDVQLAFAFDKETQGMVVIDLRRSPWAVCR